MKRGTARRCVLTLVVLLTFMGTARAYLVGLALSLEKLTGEADVIFKGTALSSAPAQGKQLKPYLDFVALETQFKVVSVLKGGDLGDNVIFRHYDQDTEPRGRVFQPQYYHFETGRTYIVFAKRARSGDILDQLWMDHKSKVDQGVLLCADAKPVASKTVKEVLWTELMTALSDTTASNVAYAIRQLDQMSEGDATFGGLSDFDRKDVLAAVRGIMSNPDATIAQAAIGVVGSHNPYMSDERALCWLATVGSATVPGIAKMDPKRTNVGGEMYWNDLVTLADSEAPGQTRAMAIRALGLARDPRTQKPIERWLTDPAPAIRASATLLLADFPGSETRQRLAALADDAAPEVRICTARAIGFCQEAELAGVLARLLTDIEPEVREAAAMSLLAFSPKNEAIASVFRANLDNAEFKPLFLIALARENPADHLDALAQVVELKLGPKNFWGGQTPAFTAWEILFKYLQAQPLDRVLSGKLDRYLDAMEKVGNYSSSEPRDIYAFYLQRGMTERAKNFRKEAKKAATYDLDYYFKQVDENPSQYKRE